MVTFSLFHILEKAEHGGAEEKREINCGHTLFKYCKIMKFYPNDLAEIPRQDVEGQSEWTLKCTHGLYTLQNWIGNESITRKSMEFPYSVVTYNLIMNSVDRFDKFRSKNTIMHRENESLCNVYFSIGCVNPETVYIIEINRSSGGGKL